MTKSRVNNGGNGDSGGSGGRGGSAGIGGKGGRCVRGASGPPPSVAKETPRRCRTSHGSSRHAASRAAESCRDRPRRSRQSRRDRSCYECACCSTMTLQLRHYRRSVPLSDPHAPCDYRALRPNATTTRSNNYITSSETAFVAISGRVTFRPGKYIVIEVSTASGFSRDGAPALRSPTYTRPTWGSSRRCRRCRSGSFDTVRTSNRTLSFCRSPCERAEDRSRAADTARRTTFGLWNERSAITKRDRKLCSTI